MSHKVVRNIRRPDADTVRLLGELGVATVHEAQGRTGLLRPYMRPIYATAKVSGPAVTVSCHPGDNLMIHAALEQCRTLADKATPDKALSYCEQIEQVAGDALERQAV